MPKSTLAFLIFLSLLAALLLGINIGKKMGNTQNIALNPAPTLPVLPTLFASPSPIVIQTSPIVLQTGLSVYSDKTCGFSIAYKGNYLEQNSKNSRSTVITDPENPGQDLVSACLEEIPKPPLVPEKIEDIIVDGVLAKLYHDASSKDGSPRDELIVKHPANNLEIIIAGFGPPLNLALASFKFIR